MTSFGSPASLSAISRSPASLEVKPRASGVDWVLVKENFSLSYHNRE